MPTFIKGSLHLANLSAMRINSLKTYAGGDCYLEIGVRDGHTFFAVDMGNKFAVDPSFTFDTATFADEKNMHFFHLTSDDFFKLLGKTNKTAITFDVIFIDGLHSFQQVMRDFENSLLYAHDNTVWLIDDTVPSSPYSALPDMELAFRIYEKLGYRHRPWHGDVFKSIFALHDFFPEYSYCTLMNKSQSVVWKTPKKDTRSPVFGAYDVIDDCTYFDVLTYAHLFNPVPEHMFLSFLGRYVQIDYPPQLWESFIYPLKGGDFVD